MNMQSVARLSGSITPLVTPFVEGRVDYATYRRLVDFHVRSGSQGIVVNGTTGEPSTLTVQERNDLVTAAVEAAAGRIVVVAASGSQSLEETKALTRHAVSAGVDALLIVTPYYVRPPQRGLVAYYLDVVEETPIPWMIYHIPGRTAVGITIESIAELSKRSPTFVGMKHAANDLGFVSECLALRSDFRIFVGLEELSFPMMAVGAVGLMNAVANLNPELLAELADAVSRHEMSRARAIHDRLLEINKAIFYDTNPIPLKYMMKRLGLIESNEHRLPMMPATPELERRLDVVLERAGLSAATPWVSS